MNTNLNVNSYLDSFKWMIPQPDNALSVVRGAYFHELAHAIAMKCLYKGVEPRIRLSINGGVTTPCFWDGRSLTTLGNFFGLNASRAMVSAAGPIMDCMTDLALGLLASSAKPHSFHLYLVCKIAQIFCVFANASYAIGCSFGKRGDYNNIKHYTGIPPIVPAAALSVRLFFVAKPLFA